jgi:hypothetical protein
MHQLSPAFEEIEALEREAAEKEAKEAAQQKSKKKNKTANKLDERFQLTDKHDREHIFPEELEMVKQLRSEIPDLRFYSDKWIVYFLCARRHEITAVKELLVKYLKMREEYGWRTCLPDIHTDTHKDMRNDSTSHNHTNPLRQFLINPPFASSTDLMYHMPGMVDNQGRLVIHFYLARSRPHGRPLAHMLAFAMWEVDYLVETETLAHLRNGTIWVCNMDGFSIMKNLDMSADGRKWSSTVSGSFPNRIRGAWIIKTGWLARAILAAGKVLFPKKIAKRFAVVKDSELVNMAPKVRKINIFLFFAVSLLSGSRFFFFERKCRDACRSRRWICC